MRTRRNGYRPEMTEVADLSPEIHGRRSRRSREGALSSIRKTIKDLVPRTKSYRRSGRRGRIMVQKSGNQRVIVKARFVRMKGDKGVKGLRVHLSYLERTGTGLEQEKAAFFDRERAVGRKELSKSVGEWSDDPHHFRFILSPEKASGIDLEAFARSVMGDVERALETKLTWFAAAHYNTDNPHVHITIRGRDDSGEPLFIDREFIKSGFRVLAEKEATRLLGPRLQQDRSAAFEKSLKESRFIGLDRELLQEANQEGGILRLGRLQPDSRERDRLRRQRVITRLHYLGSLGLAEEKRVGEWALSPDLEQTLRLLSRRKEITDELQTVLEEAERNRPLRIYEPGDQVTRPVRGEIVRRGVSDEISDTPYLLVRGEDEALHYFPLGRYSEQQGLPPEVGSFVSIQTQARSGKTDEKIVEHAFKNVGVFELNSWRAKLSEFLEPDAVQLITSRYEARLQSLERLGLVEATGDGKWRVPNDLIEKVKEVEQAIRKKLNRFRVEVLSPLSLNEQVQAGGATWLDKQIEEGLSGTEPKFRGYDEYVSRREEVLRERGVKVEVGMYERLDEQQKRSIVSAHFFGQQLATIHGSKPVDGTLVRYIRLDSGVNGVVGTSKGLVILPVQSHQDRWNSGAPVTFKKDKNGRLVMWQRSVDREKQR